MLNRLLFAGLSLFMAQPSFGAPEPSSVVRLYCGNPTGKYELCLLGSKDAYYLSTRFETGKSHFYPATLKNSTSFRASSSKSNSPDEFVLTFTSKAVGPTDMEIESRQGFLGFFYAFDNPDPKHLREYDIEFRVIYRNGKDSAASLYVKGQPLGETNFPVELPNANHPYMPAKFVGGAQ